MLKEISNYTYILTPQSQVIALDIHRGLNGRPEAPKICVSSQLDVISSLNEFCRSVNFQERQNNNPNEGIVGCFLKSNSKIVDENFFTKLIAGKGYTRLSHNYDIGLYCDGDFTLVLGYRAEQMNNDIWLAGIGFSFGGKLPESKHELVDPHHSKLSPIILQLQTVKYQLNSKGVIGLYQSARSALQDCRWEFTLVNLVVQWADQVNLPSIYILPAKENIWVKDRRLDYERAKLRYDVTARRLGFIEDPYGFYVLNLARAKS